MKDPIDSVTLEMPFPAQVPWVFGQPEAPVSAADDEVSSLTASQLPAYRQEAWFRSLARKVAASSVTTVADQMHKVSRSHLSQVLNSIGAYRLGGSYPKSIKAKFMETFNEVECDYHNGDMVSPAYCQRHGSGRAPTSAGNLEHVRHWKACQECPHSPNNQTKEKGNESPATKVAPAEHIQACTPDAADFDGQHQANIEGGGPVEQSGVCG